MKKSLSELTANSAVAAADDAPKTKSFGAFKQINGTQAVIDLDVLRKYNALVKKSL